MHGIATEIYGAEGVGAPFCHFWTLLKAFCKNYSQYLFFIYFLTYRIWNGVTGLIHTQISKIWASRMMLRCSSPLQTSLVFTIWKVMK